MLFLVFVEVSVLVLEVKVFFPQKHLDVHKEYNSMRHILRHLYRDNHRDRGYLDHAQIVLKRVDMDMKCTRTDPRYVLIPR
jgi:hypothetical protein